MAPSNNVPAAGTGPTAANAKGVGPLTYVQVTVSGAATLLQEVPIVGSVCKTSLSFEQLVETAKNNKAELGILCELCDVVIKGVLDKRSDRSGLFKGFVTLEKHVGKAERVARLCNGVGIQAIKRFVLARKICRDIASVRKNVLDFSTANNLVLTNDLHMKVDKLAAILTAKEKELEATEMSSRGMFKAAGQTEETEEYFRRALALEERKLGSDHPTVAGTLHKLRACADTAGRTEEAEKCHRRALAIRENKLGGDHPDVARSLHELGLCSWKLGRTGEAAGFLRRALTISKKKLGGDHPDVAKIQKALVKLCLSTSIVAVSKATLLVTGVLLCLTFFTRRGKTTRP